MSTTTEDKRAEQQARACMESIKEMVTALEAARESEEEIAEYEGKTLSFDEIRERILEDPLSLEVRSDWHTPCDKESEVTEYRILLAWGGPAVRIIGELSRFCEPDSATLQYQDWFTEWEDFVPDSCEDEDALLTYAREFWFGE